MTLRTLFIATLCALPGLSPAQEAEIFLPGLTDAPARPTAPEAQSPLSRCLALPGRATCAGVAMDPNAITTEAAVPQVSFETLVLDLDGGRVTSSPEPPAQAPNYQDPTPPSSGHYALPAVAMTIEFNFDSFTIRDQERGKIAGLSAALADPALANAQFAVIRHSDAIGTAAYNCALSTRRAASVAYTLQAADLPVTFYPVGFGEHVLKRPDAPRAPENRRVTFLRLPQTPGPVLYTAGQVCG